MSYRWNNVVTGFSMPVKLENGEWLHPTTEWKSTTVTGDILEKGLRVDKNFYIVVSRLTD
jgi:hypothetical protein